MVSSSLTSHGLASKVSDVFNGVLPCCYDGKTKAMTIAHVLLIS